MEDMMKTVMITVVELTTRAVKAEEVEASLRAVIEKLENDRDYWKRECFKLGERLEKLKGESNA